MKNVFLVLSILVLCACSHKKAQQDKYGWVNDSLNMEVEGLRKSGRWIDSTKTMTAFALYQSDTLNIMRTLILETRGTVDSPVNLSDWEDGVLEIRPIDLFDFNGEYFVVKQGRLWLYNKENKHFGTATKLSYTR